MAKSKSFIKGTFSGNVGTMNFRDRGDDMVAAARVYTNKSKGNGATDLQRAHRCKLANVVNFYKAKPALFARAFESKGKHQSDFNKFVQLNLPNATLMWSKEQAQWGWFLGAAFKLSEGSLHEVRGVCEDEVFKFGSIIGGSSYDWDDKTIGEISTDLLNRNSWLKAGDQVTIVYTSENTAYTQVGTLQPVFLGYMEFVLDSTSNVNFSTVRPNLLSSLASTTSGITLDGPVSVGIIVSRMNGAVLQVSSSVMAINADFGGYARYDTADQRAAAMNSYGYKDHALLVPGE